MSQAMFSFHRRINKNEQIVGWFATTNEDGSYINEFSTLINEFYNDQCKNPVHIVIDTTLVNDKLVPHGFICQPMIVDGNVCASVFNEIQVEMVYSSGEQTCFHHMMKDQIPISSSKNCNTTILSTLPTEKIKVEKTIQDLLKLVNQIKVYFIYS
jgi:translation initiation factor 3 subunit F